MERRLSIATAKIRNLKELIVNSTLNLNSSSNDAKPHNKTPMMLDHSSLSRNGAQNNSISLFDLVDPTIRSYETPYYGQSVSPPTKSISMYGIASINAEKGVNTSHKRHSNPAIRLFYTLRAKLKRRNRRDSNKVVAAKTSDFGPFMTENQYIPRETPRESFDNGARRRFLQSMENISYPSTIHDDFLFENNFSTPLGARTRGSQSQIQVAVELPDPQINEQELGEMDSTPQQQHQQAMIEGVNLLPPPLSQHAYSNSSCSNASGHSSTRTNNTFNSTRQINSNEIGSPSKKCLTNELQDLLHHHGWYWAGITKDEAEEKLRGQPDGAFIVRDSSSDHYLLSLSFNSNSKTLHTRIEYRNGQFCFYSSEALGFDSVSELIENCISNSETGVFCYSKVRRSEGRCYPVRLTKPISRFTEVKSLRHLCRFTIRQIYRVDLIPLLPLPPTLIEYVSEKKYIT